MHHTTLTGQTQQNAVLGKIKSFVSLFYLQETVKMPKFKKNVKILITIYLIYSICEPGVMKQLLFTNIFTTRSGRKK